MSAPTYPSAMSFMLCGEYNYIFVVKLPSCLNLFSTIGSVSHLLSLGFCPPFNHFGSQLLYFFITTIQDNFITVIWYTALKFGYKIKYKLHEERLMCCNLAGSVGSRQHWLWDIARKRNEFPLFSIVLRILPIAHNHGTTGPIQVEFSAKCTSPIMSTLSNRKLKMSHVQVPTDFPRNICYEWYNNNTRWNSYITLQVTSLQICRWSFSKYLSSVTSSAAMMLWSSMWLFFPFFTGEPYPTQGCKTLSWLTVGLFFDLFAMTILYEAEVNNSVKNISMEIRRIV